MENKDIEKVNPLAEPLREAQQACLELEKSAVRKILFEQLEQIKTIAQSC